VRIMQTSTERSLVLLDELGTSTDPNEGSALARAILLHFLSRGTFTVATTHYGELKIFAHVTPGLQNASLEFDPVTLTPTYHLAVGIPGGSNALTMASQLGVAPDIIASARDMLSEGTEEMEKLLIDLTSEKQATRSLRTELETEKDKAANLRNRLEGELQRLKEQEQHTLLQARDRVAGEAARLQKEIRQASSELKKAKSKERIEQAQKALKEVREELASPAWQTKPIRGEVDEEGTEAGSIAAGDRVRLLDTNIRGTVLTLSERDSQVEIQAGRTIMRLSVEDVEKVKPSDEKVTPGPSMVKKSLSGRKRSLELDLRGKRAEEIEPELDSYLNDVSLAGFREIRIIHGFGTGTVRQIVRDMLASHPLAKSFRAGEREEGGDGVTMVEL